MLTEHKELLGKIRQAEKAALALYEAGAKISSTVLSLRAAGKEIATRVEHYESSERKSKRAAARAPKTETQTPDTVV